MKKLLVTLSVLSLPFFIMSMMPDPSSSGAPASHTGAPDENTCGAVGCHDDKAINSGTAKLNIEIGNSITQYVPGKTYKIKVKITDAKVTRFGFQVVALFDQDHSNAGTIQITDLKRTQIVTNYKDLTNRKYITYTFNGTDAVSSGVGEWTFDWTAPTNNLGPVTFYTGGVSANDDMDDQGDYVYTNSVTITKQ